MKEKWGKGDSVPDTQIFKLDFTKSKRYHKRKIMFKRRGSGTAWQDAASAISASPASLEPAAAMSHLLPTGVVSSNKNQPKRKPTFVIPAQGSSSAAAAIPEEAMAVENISELQIVRAGTTTLPTGPMSLVEEGLDYPKLARAASKLVYTHTAYTAVSGSSPGAP